MRNNHKQRNLSFIGNALLLVVVVVLMSLNYIDLKAILSVYLPVWVISIAFTLLGKWVFGGMLAIAACVGLISEYLVHLSRPSRPSMSGAVLNLFIVAIGAVVGIALEVVRSRRS